MHNSLFYRIIATLLVTTILLTGTPSMPISGITNLYDLYNPQTGHRIILIGEEHGEIGTHSETDYLTKKTLEPIIKRLIKDHDFIIHLETNDETLAHNKSNIQMVLSSLGSAENQKKWFDKMVPLIDTLAFESHTCWQIVLSDRRQGALNHMCEMHTNYNDLATNFHDNLSKRINHAPELITLVKNMKSTEALDAFLCDHAFQQKLILHNVNTIDLHTYLTDQLKHGAHNKLFTVHDFLKQLEQLKYHTDLGKTFFPESSYWDFFKKKFTLVHNIFSTVMYQHITMNLPQAIPLIAQKHGGTTIFFGHTDTPNVFTDLFNCLCDDVANIGFLLGLLATKKSILYAGFKHCEEITKILVKSGFVKNKFIPLNQLTSEKDEIITYQVLSPTQIQTFFNEIQ